MLLSSSRTGSMFVLRSGMSESRESVRTLDEYGMTRNRNCYLVPERCGSETAARQAAIVKLETVLDIERVQAQQKQVANVQVVNQKPKTTDVSILRDRRERKQPVDCLYLESERPHMADSEKDCNLE